MLRIQIPEATSAAAVMFGKDSAAASKQQQAKQQEGEQQTGERRDEVRTRRATGGDPRLRLLVLVVLHGDDGRAWRVRTQVHVRCTAADRTRRALNARRGEVQP